MCMSVSQRNAHIHQKYIPLIGDTLAANLDHRFRTDFKSNLFFNVNYKTNYFHLYLMVYMEVLKNLKQLILND